MLDKNQPFALVAKPCDLSAVYNLAQHDERVDRLCVLRMAMVCGGQSRLSKSQALLDEFELDERDLAVFRYRGYGNPGPTHVETHQGQVFGKSYLDLWEDESGWDLETRCKVCADALGECADVVATDVWPGGSPVGEDEGFNGIIVRTAAGKRLVDDAVANDRLTLGESISPRQFDHFQPHQVTKKQALKARFAGIKAARGPVLAIKGLRVDELSHAEHSSEFTEQKKGAQERFEKVSSSYRSDQNN